MNKTGATILISVGYVVAVCGGVCIGIGSQATKSVVIQMTEQNANYVNKCKDIGMDAFVNLPNGTNTVVSHDVPLKVTVSCTPKEK